MDIELPVGRGHLHCHLEHAAVITSGVSQLQGAQDGQAIVKAAMQKPYGGKTLAQLAVGKKTATVIISDHTRPVPSRDILPPMLEELRQGNPEIEITLLVATGCHRETSPQELEEKLGSEIAQRERIVVHDAHAPERNVQIGILPSGAPLVLDRLAAETELLVAEGFIEPHFFAGFSGGRKSVMPGVCDKITVLGNHCGAFIHDPHARTGILEGNPIHGDMVAAADMAHLEYIVNVVIDEQKRTVAAFAGAHLQAHAAGVAFLKKYCQVPAVPGDIVITTNGGAPLDQNLYQCVKSLTAAERCAKEGAVLILCAELADGIGGDGFYQALARCQDPAALYDHYTNTPQTLTEPDQWQTQIFCRILAKHRVIVVTGAHMEAAIREMKLEYAPTLEQALAMAGEGDITVIPNGISVMIV